MSGASPQLESTQHNKSAAEVAGPQKSRAISADSENHRPRGTHRNEVYDDGPADGPIDHAKGGVITSETPPPSGTPTTASGMLLKINFAPRATVDQAGGSSDGTGLDHFVTCTVAADREETV